jgi:TonB family protein
MRMEAGFQSCIQAMPDNMQSSMALAGQLGRETARMVGGAIRRGSIAALLFLSSCDVADREALTERLGFPARQPPPPIYIPGLIVAGDPAPMYPLRARELGIEGWVLLNFSVDQLGNVIPASVEILDQEPQGFFEQSAINAVRRMNFENSLGQTVNEVNYVFRFELEERDGLLSQSRVTAPRSRNVIPMRYVTPDYPAAAREQGIEGFVIVEFDVSASGAVENVRIVESAPEAVFDAAALRAAQRLRFVPRLLDDVPVRAEDVTHRFNWRLSD